MKHRTLLLLPVGLVMLLIVGAAHGHTVTMNIAYHLGDDKADDTIHVAGSDIPATEYVDESYDDLARPYISSESQGTVAALVFGGSQFINAYLRTSYTSEDYLFGMMQDDRENRFVIAVTRGTWRDIDTQPTVPSQTYGSLQYQEPRSFLLFSRLQFETVDLLADATLTGERLLVVRNAGVAGGRTLVDIGVVQ